MVGDGLSMSQRRGQVCGDKPKMTKLVIFGSGAWQCGACAGAGLRYDTRMVSSFKSTSGWRRILRAWGYSLNGLRAAFRHEAAFRQELLLAAVLAPCAFWVGDDALQIVLLLASLAAVLIVELLNSAVETLADAVSTEHHPLIGRAKDIGSAAVLLTLGMAAAVWLAVLLT